MTDYSTFTQDELNESFLNACQAGDFDMVEYLLTSPQLDMHAEVDADDDMGLIKACENGHLEVVRYLLTAPELSQHADIHADDDEALKGACYHGHLNVVRYLVSSPELTEHANVHADNDSALVYAYSQGHQEVVTYFLYDMKINPQILPKLNEKTSPMFPNHTLGQLVSKRDLFFKINSTLLDTDTRKDLNSCGVKAKI